MKWQNQEEDIGSKYGTIKESNKFLKISNKLIIKPTNRKEIDISLKDQDLNCH